MYMVAQTIIISYQCATINPSVEFLDEGTNMIDAKIFEEAAKKICDKLPEGLKNAKGDFEGQVKSVLQTMFSKMDLVTHQEFDQQKAILKRCEQKISALEKQLKDVSH